MYTVQCQYVYLLIEKQESYIHLQVFIERYEENTDKILYSLRCFLVS